MVGLPLMVPLFTVSTVSISFVLNLCSEPLLFFYVYCVGDILITRLSTKPVVELVLNTLHGMCPLSLAVRKGLPSCLYHGTCSINKYYKKCMNCITTTWDIELIIELI